jgi:hypothetical protein
VTTYEPPLFDHALDVDELNRSLLFKRQRQQRAAYRVVVQDSLQGNPIAAMTLRDKFQPLLDHRLDMQAPDMGDDPETQPVSNQNLNAS